MTKDEVIAELHRIAEQLSHDKEQAHGAADVALLRYINDPEIEAAYDAIEVWYA